MDNLRIATYNCRGLNNCKKRQDVFNMFKEKKTDILCLQETHFVNKEEKNIYSEWDGDCYFSHGKSNAKGVAILFKKHLDIKIFNTLTDDTGSFIMVELAYCETKFILINIYAPNKDDPSFYDTIFRKIDTFSNNNSFIICGDFNLVLNPFIDYENYKSTNHNTKARNRLLSMINDKNLIDVFRELHGDTKKYTWRRFTPLQQGRLDFFLITDNLKDYLKNCEIDISYKSDHSMVFLDMLFSTLKHGKGLWKFNNSLLNDSEYITCINKRIEEIILQYCVPIYSLENILTVDREDIQFIIDDQLFLETLLMEIRGKTIAYSSYKIKEKNKYSEKLEAEILELESKLTDENKERLLFLQNELTELRNNKLRGSFVRSRSNWIENGEKVTKYFCNLEKQHISNKSIPFIEKENGQQIYNQNEILEETSNFYKKLFSQRNTFQDFDLERELSHCNVNKLNIDQINNLEGLLSYTEVTNTLKYMKNDKSPGCDGFSSNFYKVFWNKIGKFVVRALNHAFISNYFSKNIKLGSITCIPKEKKAKQFLKNWRPITLLNVVYKLASGSIANRLKKVLCSLISNDQTGFIKDRFIGENTRLVYDIMKYCEDHHMPGLVMLIDFEKAFDSLSFNFIEKTLTFFNFGEMFRKWIHLFLYNTQVCVQLNGFLSEFFTIERGCRQGDPISAYIFILCAEILSIKIRNSKGIKGIKIKDEEYIISQFADDTSLFLDGSEESLKTVLEVLQYFSVISGLNVNFDKTKVIWIGSLKYSTRSIKTRWKLSWGETQFKLLGIYFDVNLNKMQQLNFQSKVTKMEKTISYWKRRKLTPIGRITVVKSLLIPLLTNLFISLPSPSKTFMKNLSDMLSNFVWDGKAKIKKSVFIKDYNEGGIRMIDIEKYEISMKIKWFKSIICNSKSKCYKLVECLFDINKIFNTGKIFCEHTIKLIKNKFWIDVLKSYILFINKFTIENFDQLLNMPLFYNDNFKINSNFVYMSDLYKKGIRYVKDIMNDNGDFQDVEYIENVIGKKINYLNYFGLIYVVKNVIVKYKLLKERNILLTCHNPCINCYLQPILTRKDGNKYVYNTLIKNKETPTSKEKWLTLYENYDINWKITYSNIFKCTKDTYLQWLQTRIVHRILPTNSLLFKMNIIDNNLCTFCKISEETLIHLFYDCEKLKPLLRFVSRISKISDPKIIINSKNIILGFYDSGYQYDIINLEMKKYIFLCKKKEIIPSIIGFKKNLKLSWEIFKLTNVSNTDYEKWAIVRSCLQE